MTTIQAMPREIELLRQAVTFLAECKNLDELKTLKDKAEALRLYYSKQKEGTAAENAAGEIVLRAARRIGEVVKEIKPKQGERSDKLRSNLDRSSKSAVVANSGIKPTEGKRCEAIAEIPVEEFEASIAESAAKGKSVTLSAAEKNGRAKKKKDNLKKAVEQIAKEPPPIPKGPFRVIVVDPPWTYDKRAEDPTHRAALPYPSMTIEQIKALDVAGLAGPDCVLWLWTTNAHMREAFGILDAWGFTFKTILTWVKDKMGTGDWLRGQTEHCLMAVRGKPTIKLTNQTTVLRGPLRKHSQKPDEFYQLVESLCPGSKLEMFSRQQREGWMGHGNESG
jgi:N6-adenosine-specific RNA methylase IME4